MLGYNILSGDPYSQNQDPGLKNQIFATNADGGVDLDAVTAYDLMNCRKSLSSTSFTSAEEYR